MVSSDNNFESVNVEESNVGSHLEPEDFHNMIEKEDVVLIDIRNKYEYDIGHFENAIHPDMRNHSELLPWFEENSHLFDKKKKVLMYCTGGIRCEKASAFAR